MRGAFWAAVVLMGVADLMLNSKAGLPSLWVLALSAAALGLYLSMSRERGVSARVPLLGRELHPFLPYWLLPPLATVFIGGPVMVLSSVVLGLLLAGLCYGAALYFSSSSGGLKYAARFANAAELTELRLAEISKRGEVSPLKPGVIVGENAAGLYGVAPGLQGQPELGHVLVIGPTRRGKGLNLTTNLLLWPGSAVVTDIKQECLASGYRASLGRVVVLDPTGRGQRYDPVRDLGGDQQALLTAALLLLKAEGDGDRIFAERAASAVVAAFRAAQLAERPSVPYLAELVQGGLIDFVAALAPVQDRFLQANLTRFLGRQPAQMTRADYSGKFLESAWSTLTARLAPLFTDEVLAMLDGHDFSAAELLSGERPLTVYLSFPERSLEANRAAFELVLYGLTRGLMLAGDGGAVRRQGVLLLADEAKRASIPELPEVLATLAGRGVSVVTYVQDIEQLTEAYGQSGAASVLSNSQTQCWYTPADLKTAEYLSKRLGKFSYMQRGTSNSAGVSWGPANEEQLLGSLTRSSSSGVSHSETDRELLTPDELLKAPLDQVVTFVGTLPPAKLQRASWLGRPELERRVNLPAVPRPVLRYEPATGPQVPRSETMHHQPTQEAPAALGELAMLDELN